MGNLGGILFTLIFTHMNYVIATDYENGLRDPIGPYPRIPPKELVEKEIKFAEECKKYIKSPKEIFIIN